MSCGESVKGDGEGGCLVVSQCGVWATRGGGEWLTSIMDSESEYGEERNRELTTMAEWGIFRELKPFTYFLFKCSYLWIVALLCLVLYHNYVHLKYGSMLYIDQTSWSSAWEVRKTTFWISCHIPVRVKRPPFALFYAQIILAPCMHVFLANKTVVCVRRMVFWEKDASGGVL